jgi:hypothetical protein
VTYFQRIEILAKAVAEAVAYGREASDIGQRIGDGAGKELSEVSDRLFDIALELDETPRDQRPNMHGAPLVLLADFPYPHPDDRDLRRLALYHAPSGDDTGEFIIWSEVREADHDGFREASRCWGIYHAYTTADERDTAYYEALDKFSYKCARIVGPFVRSEHRGYRRSEG